MQLRCLVPSSDGLKRAADYAAALNLAIIYVITLPVDESHAYWTGHDTVQSRYNPLKPVRHANGNADSVQHELSSGTALVSAEQIERWPGPTSTVFRLARLNARVNRLGSSRN